MRRRPSRCSYSAVADRTCTAAIAGRTERQARSLPLWTISNSAAFGRAGSAALAGERRAAGIARVSVLGVQLRVNRDVGLCSIEHDELTAVLLLRQQRGHAAQPVPRLWNGRKASVLARWRQASARRPGRQKRTVVAPAGSWSTPLVSVASRTVFPSSARSCIAFVLFVVRHYVGWSVGLQARLTSSRGLRNVKGRHQGRSPLVGAQNRSSSATHRKGGSSW